MIIVRNACANFCVYGVLACSDWRCLPLLPLILSFIVFVLYFIVSKDSLQWHLCLVSSVTFPFIRSNRIEFYFSVSVRSVMRMYTARKRQRRYGTAVWTRITETVTETDTDERKRNAGNQALTQRCAKSPTGMLRILTAIMPILSNCRIVKTLAVNDEPN